MTGSRYERVTAGDLRPGDLLLFRRDGYPVEQRVTEVKWWNGRRTSSTPTDAVLIYGSGAALGHGTVLPAIKPVLRVLSDPSDRLSP